jgi:hypothetical protein
VQIDIALWGLDPRDNFQLHDLLTDTRYFRSGARPASRSKCASKLRMRPTRS